MHVRHPDIGFVAITMAQLWEMAYVLALSSCPIDSRMECDSSLMMCNLSLLMALVLHRERLRS